MATFTELLDEVYAITNRPDLVNETKLAVKAATLKLHQIDFFWKDLTEAGLNFEAERYVQELDYRSVLTRFRSLKYLRKAESDGTVGILFKEIDPVQILDQYSYQKDNVYYAAGAVIQIKSSDEFQYALVGYYQHPDVTESTYNSWIALDHPYAIVFEAAAKIFKMIGYGDQEQSMRVEVMEQVQMIKASNIELGGH